MGLYSKAETFKKKDQEGKGLFNKALKIYNQTVSTYKHENKNELNLSVQILEELTQQINLCKINRVSLALICITISSFMEYITQFNKGIDIDDLKNDIFTFIENLLIDEAKLIRITDSKFLFTIYNPKKLEPELVLHQMIQALLHYYRLISKSVDIDFEKNIKYFPQDGADARSLLFDLL